MKLLLKGVDSAEDARIAREPGVDGIIVSNPGARATVATLPEVVDAAGNQIPVLIDGGVRRGNSAYRGLWRWAHAQSASEGPTCGV